MIKEYIIKETLGKGTYGIVYKVQKMNTNEIYVIKQIPLRGLSQKEIDEVKQEAKILSSINSDFVVKYYDSFEENEIIYIVMEYCDEGDLNDFIIKKKANNILIEEYLIWNLFIKITIGLAQLHQMKILHRDLKTLNIFLKNGFQIKIGDLGVAKILLKNSFAKTLIGTPFYLSPEMCQAKPYNDKSDVWALGCILYELCTFKHPFDAKSQGALILKIMNNVPENINKYYSKDLSNLIYLLLEKDAEKRPSCIDILNLDFVINQGKKLGLFNYIKHFIRDNNNNNIKISPKIIDFNNKNKNNNNNENNSKNNFFKEFDKKNINNNNSNQNKNIGKKNNHNGIKINEIVLGNNPKNNFNRQPISNRNLNGHVLFNNFFINNEKNKYNKKLSNVIISKKNDKINSQGNHDIISKKIGGINPFKLELNIPQNPSVIIKNGFHGKLLTNRNNDKKMNLNFEKEKIILNNNINIKKIITNNKNHEKEIKIKKGHSKGKIFIENNFKNIIKKDGLLSNNNMINKDNKYIIKYNKILDDGNNKNNNKYLINILQNNGKIKSKIIKKDENNEKENFEKEESTNFEIINNVSNNSIDIDNKSENNNNNDLEDSIEEFFVNNPKTDLKYSKNNNIEDKNGNENLRSSEYDQEKVKEIKENNITENKLNNNNLQLSKKQEELKNEISCLNEKIKDIKKDIFNLIGEDDYKFIMDLFENKINNINGQNNNDEMCEEIENFSNNKYTPEKKEKFFDYYLLLVCNDCLLSKKMNELQNLNI